MQELKVVNSSGIEVILSNSKPFILEKVENVANNTGNIYSSSTGQDGITIDEITIKEKLLPVTAGIKTDSVEDLDRKRAFLSSFFNPKDTFTLFYTNNIVTRKINARVQDIAFQQSVLNIQKFLVQFICPNPFWKDINTNKNEIALWLGDFEFPLEMSSNGIEMGHRKSNLIVNIINKGDLSAGIKICFKALATVVNPSLFNINTREFIKINRSLNAGDILEVTTELDNERIELLKNNGTRENVFNWLDLDSEFIKLKPGDNLFRYDAESGIDNLEVSIYNYDLFVGV